MHTKLIFFVCLDTEQEASVQKGKAIRLCCLCIQYSVTLAVLFHQSCDLVKYVPYLSLSVGTLLTHQLWCG